MRTEKLEDAIALSKKTGFALISTADRGGVPHVAAAGRMELTDVDSVSVREWFCSVTMANLGENKLLSVVVWDKDSDSGYQMFGEVERIEDRAILDGYAPDLESESLPQVERELRIKVQRIVGFKLGPHSDTE